MSITGPNILKSMSIIIWELFKMLLIIVLSSVQVQPVLKGITQSTIHTNGYVSLFSLCATRPVTFQNKKPAA